MKVGVHGLLVLGALVAATPRDAEACSYSFNELYTPPGDASDTTPPIAPSATVQVSRSQAGGTCSATGLVSIDVIGSDDTTPAAEIAYIVDVASGDPASLAIAAGRPYGAMLSRNLNGSLFLMFDYDDSLDLELSIRAVDRNGNIGPATLARVTIGPPTEPAGDLFGDEDDEAGGCSVSSSVSSSSGGLAMLAALALLRRRHRR